MTQDKTFEELFPELKGNGLYPIDTNCLEEKDNVFLKKEIQKHCLSKQGVKEVINKLNVWQHDEAGEKIEKIVSVSDLLKELGLQ